MADLMYMQRLANELALKGAMTAPTRYRIVVAVVSPELDRIACASIARSPEEVERILQWGLDNLAGLHSFHVKPPSAKPAES
jgi:hypothetical protein